jgi:hypothetical protein
MLGPPVAWFGEASFHGHEDGSGRCQDSRERHIWATGVWDLGGVRTIITVTGTARPGQPSFPTDNTKKIRLHE